jgi:hypothetical protein
MTKKSALTMAAGLALALLVGVAAMTLTFGGAGVANASRERKPIVKHQAQTVTVHRKADASPLSGGLRVVQLGSSGSGMSSGSDDAFDDEADDDAFENEANDDAFENEANDAFDDDSHQGSSSSGSSWDD